MITLLLATSLHLGLIAPSISKPLMRDFIGLNGHTVQFKPDLYGQAVKVVRDYHPVAWDLGDNLDGPAKFPMTRNGIDWDQLYGGWKKDGFTIDLCAQVESIPAGKWTDMSNQAEAYGEALAKSFGPSSDHKLVESVEVGNEPGKFSDAQYRTMFESMAKGLRKGDPKLLISTCAVTTATNDQYCKNIEDIKGLESLYDVLNIHTYAFKEMWPTWKRSYPEDPSIAYLTDTQKVIDWRNANAPGKQIWVTEFGWDSSTKQPAKTGDFSKWVGSTDTEQAAYIVRSFLVFSAMDLQKAYLYYFNDEDEPSLHAASGLTRHFQPKPSFYAVAHLQKTLGDYRFDRVIESKVGEVYDYQFRSDKGDLVWAVWSPTGSQRTGQVVLPKPPGKIIRGELMPLDASTAKTVSVQVNTDGTVTTPISESPTYLWIPKS